MDLRLHAHDQVVVGEGLDVRERVDTVGAQVLRGVRRVEHARQRPHLVALPVVVRGRAVVRHAVLKVREGAQGEVAVLEPV